MKHVFPDTAAVKEGHLHIGGCDAVELAAAFGTPLIVLDKATFVRRAEDYASAVGAPHVYYAGKSFLCVAVCEMLDELGLGLDVCSGGELSVALAAGFPAERIIFHGNNKSALELDAARRAGVGRIAVDSFEEIERIADAGVDCKLLIRVTPGVEAHTHEFVQTGQEDSKFGFGLADGAAFEAVKRCLSIRPARLVGLHAHIGSQIFEMAAFDLAVQRFAGFCERLKKDLGFEPEELDLGGGLGIAYTEDETAPDIKDSLQQTIDTLDREFKARGLTLPRLYVEPGRSIAGPSAVTIYEVGTVKTIPGIRTYVSVDGGMSDNIRPALYGSRYEARLANRMDALGGPPVTVSGKHCESGDVLIKDVALPADVAPGDLLVIPATGSYTYSMASNYNHITRPPVVLVEDGRATEIVRRESHEDLLRLDRRLNGSPLSGS